MNEYTDRYITSPGEGPMTWDDNGNLVTEVIDLSTGDQLQYFWDPHNRLRGVSFEAGSLLALESGKGTGFPMPERAIPISEKTRENAFLGGPIDIARYNYFTNNLRSEAIAENTTVDRHQHFYWDGAEVVQTFSVSGSTQTIQKTFVNGRILDEHLLMLYGSNQEAWLHPDEHGNVLQVSDDTGNTLDEIYFQDQHGGAAFFDGTGASLTVSQLLGNPWFFQGRELDYETQNYYFRNRYYEWSPIPQFLSRDAGDIWGDPLSLGDATNAFAGNPTNFVDPFAFESGYVDENDSWGNFGRDAGDYDCMGRYTGVATRAKEQAYEEFLKGSMAEESVTIEEYLKQNFIDKTPVSLADEATLDWLKYVDFLTRQKSPITKIDFKKGSRGRCTENDPCPVIAAKLFAVKAVIAYRWADMLWWNFSGKNKPEVLDTHMRTVAELGKRRLKCEALWREKCRNWPPPPWWRPEPSPVKVGRPVRINLKPLVRGVGAGLATYAAYKAIRAAAISVIATPAAGAASLVAP